jgi:hypothetical protein
MKTRPMKTSIAWVSCVAFGLCVGAACAGALTGPARADEAGVADPAQPGACGAAIARLETVLSQAHANGYSVASAPESRAARLHHQPTPDSVAKAQSDSETRVEASIERARRLRQEGRRSECIATVEKVTLGMR